jgi:signal peptide peptidase SppA
MPLPKPNKDESKKDFIDRCMGDDAMNEEFPETDQRRAVCESQWKKDGTGTRAISILPQVYGKVWAILPDSMRAILASINQKTTANTIDFEAYRKKEATRFSNIKGQTHILPLYGVVTPKASILSMLFGGTPLDYFGAAFDAAIESPSVGAVVIDVDSPGGSVYGVEELTDKIYRARGTKPIITSVNGLCASAAYWIASAADELVISSSSEAGSIGIIAEHVDVLSLEAKEGVRFTTVTAGKYKSEGNEHGALDHNAYTALKGRVDEYYETMVSDIARNRGVEKDRVKTGFGEGRVWGARQARAARMVDKIGTLEHILKRLHPSNRKRETAMHERTEQLRAEF